MKKLVILILAGILLLIIVGLAIFSLSSKAKPVSPQDAQNLISELSPMAQNFFDGMTSEDYKKASINFNGIMREKMPLQELETLNNQLNEKIGNLVNPGFPEVTTQGNNIILEYKAEFEKEKNITIRVVFNKEPGGYKIAGLWFDSPKLRK